MSRKKNTHNSNLKKQVDLVNQKASAAVEKLAHSDMNHEEFGIAYNKIKKAFAIMYATIKLGEEMKKLKDE